MKQVNIHEAKTHFSKLAAEVEAGGEIVVARNGKPVLRMVKVQTERPRRVLGGWNDLPVFTDEEWKALDAEILANFEESLNEPLEPLGMSNVDGSEKVA